MSKDNFEDVAKGIFNSYKDIIGRASEGIAKRNSNIKLNDEKEIEEFNGGKEELGNFIEDVQNTIGDVAIRVAKEEIQDNQNLKEENTPQIIKNK